MHDHTGGLLVAVVFFGLVSVFALILNLLTQQELGYSRRRRGWPSRRYRSVSPSDRSAGSTSPPELVAGRFT
ncbi:hypothetical protein BAY61_24590 [Prauserella marina]|uniref:Uncharacterized protein n=1 Tax=Prauserella marina TaxID=530584 RepID=A0A222VUS9_9PSEU|nr:hypothetical protein [Prauserella marina]ASR37654.1 hypothetical protein BAY61_24590 [Prauserella marina]PWV75576.1 hypothetical protein DES30_106193 [Prauserella marina]SDD31484.1 hypothetical protein SAMN05421630_107247 [Prauserella marina]